MARSCPPAALGDSASCDDRRIVCRGGDADKAVHTPSQGVCPTWPSPVGRASIAPSARRARGFPWPPRIRSETVMLHRMSEMPPGTLGFEARGEVEDDDWEHVVEPVLRREIADG